MTITEKMLIDDLTRYNYMFETALDYLENSEMCPLSDDVVHSTHRCNQFDCCRDCWRDYISEDAKKHCPYLGGE